MKKWMAGVLTTVIAVSAFAGSTLSVAAESESTANIGLVLSTGGLGDKNFNDMAYDGITRAEQELGISFDYMEPETSSDYVPFLRLLAEANEYDLIIGLGSDMGEAVEEVAEDFPDIKFTHIDSSMDSDIVSCVQTRWPEQTFLSGVVAGIGTLSDMEYADSENNVVGVIVGMETPALKNGVAGFTAGVKYVNPDCEVILGNVESFNDPAKGKEIALSMYNQGADFIQSLAGASGMGIYTAAEEAGRYAFGVGANVNYLYPEHIVATSARKVDEMVYNEIAAVLDDTWSAGQHITGLKESAVGIEFEESNVAVSDEVHAIVDEIRELIINEELQLPDSTTDMDEWVAENQYQK